MGKYKYLIPFNVANMYTTDTHFLVLTFPYNKKIIPTLSSLWNPPERTQQQEKSDLGAAITNISKGSFKKPEKFFIATELPKSKN